MLFGLVETSLAISKPIQIVLNHLHNSLHRPESPSHKSDFQTPNLCSVSLSFSLFFYSFLFNNSSYPVAEGDAFSILSKPEQLRSTEGLHFCPGSRNQHWTALLLIRLNDRTKAVPSKTSHTHVPGVPSKPRTALICIRRKKTLHNIP